MQDNSLSNLHLFYSETMQSYLLWFSVVEQFVLVMIKIVLETKVYSLVQFYFSLR